MSLPIPTRIRFLGLAILGAVATFTGCAEADFATSPGGKVINTDVGPVPGSDIGGQTPNDDVNTGPDAELDAGRDGDAAETLETAATLADKETKGDPDFLVPPSVAAKTQVALSGLWAAWVERTGSGFQLMVWALDDASAPTPLPIANLNQPRQLVIGDDWLFYVDDRYGDADVFAVDLITGAHQTIAANPGAQEAPSAFGDQVVWQDCRDCVDGDTGAARELYKWSAGEGVVERLTDNAVEDASPRFDAPASLGDPPTMSWVRGGFEVVVDRGGSPPLAVSFEVPVVSTAVTNAGVAVRASKGIVNPDSMIPSDLWVVSETDGTSLIPAIHAPTRAGVSQRVDVDAGHLAWLQSLEVGARLQVVSATDGAPVWSRDALGIASFALAGQRIAFIAPRADNGNLPDVWIAILP